MKTVIMTFSSNIYNEYIIYINFYNERHILLASLFVIYKPSRHIILLGNEDLLYQVNAGMLKSVQMFVITSNHIPCIFNQVLPITYFGPCPHISYIYIAAQWSNSTTTTIVTQ